MEEQDVVYFVQTSYIEVSYGEVFGRRQEKLRGVNNKVFEDLLEAKGYENYIRAKYLKLNRDISYIGIHKYNREWFTKNIDWLY